MVILIEIGFKLFANYSKIFMCNQCFRLIYRTHPPVSASQPSVLCGTSLNSSRMCRTNKKGIGLFDFYPWLLDFLKGLSFGKIFSPWKWDFSCLPGLRGHSPIRKFWGSQHRVRAHQFAVLIFHWAIIIKNHAALPKGKRARCADLLPRPATVVPVRGVCVQQLFESWHSDSGTLLPKHKDVKPVSIT